MAKIADDFRPRFEADRRDWLRRRCVWYAAVLLCYHAFAMAEAFFFQGGWDATGSETGNAAVYAQRVTIVAEAVRASVAAGAIGFVWLRAPGRGGMLRLAYWLVVVVGMVSLLTPLVLNELQQYRIAYDTAGQVQGEATRDGEIQIVFITRNALVIFFSHMLACAFLPWTWIECFRPLAPLVALNALFTMLYAQGSLVGPLVSVAVFPLLGVPGAAVCAWRHSRFSERFQLRELRGAHGRMRRELEEARGMQEGLFPDEVAKGQVRIRYAYEPMLEIGGDFLFLSTCPEGTHSVVLVDVTGHGLAAAMTVNRLHGELERIFAQRPGIEPDDVARTLNSYIVLTLAKHRIYATALCCKVDPNKKQLRWVNAGHPPMLLVRDGAGKVAELASNVVLMGACDGEQFDPHTKTDTLADGDAVLLYTDGATESRDDNGEMLGIDGLVSATAMLAEETGGLDDGAAQAVLAVVQRRRAGRPQDDTLVVVASIRGTAKRP